MRMPLNIDWQQILLHLLNFVVLFGILYFLLYNPVKKFMAKRQEYYKQMDDEAKDTLKEAQIAKEEYTSKLENADQEIVSKKEESRLALQNVYENKIKEADEVAEKIIQDARERGEREKEKLLMEAQKEIADMVVRATEKLAVNSSASDAYDQFLSSLKGSDSNA